MKKIRIFLMIMCLSVTNLILLSCGNKKDINEIATNNLNETLEENNEKKKFIVGFDAEYPPYGYLSDDGVSYEGFDLDLAKEFCNRAGYEFVAQPIDWNSKDLELNSGNIDCIWNGFTITGREDNYTWSFPYVDNSIVLIVKFNSDIVNKSDLSGKVVMAQAGSSGLAALLNKEDAETYELTQSFKSLEQCPDYNNGFMSLEAGMVDCLVVDIGVAKYKLNNSNGVFRQLDEKLNSEQYAIGFKKGNTLLRDEVQNVIAEMWKDGTFMEIANKYTSFSLPDMVCVGDYIK